MFAYRIGEQKIFTCWKQQMNIRWVATIADFFSRICVKKEKTQEGKEESGLEKKIQTLKYKTTNRFFLVVC